MGQVKQAIIQVEDFVAGCLRQGRTLNQTIRDARESIAAKTNPNKAVGIGEHPQFIEEIDKQLTIIGCAMDKLRVIDKYYPNEDDIPF